MLEALSFLLEKQGRSQAAPLAAGVKPGRTRCSVRPVPLHRCRMLRASYIPGTGTGRQGSAPYPASERPHPQNATNYPKLLHFWFIQVRVSYILEQERGEGRTAPLSRRPRNHNKCCK